MPELIPAEPGSPEWLAARRAGVTAERPFACCRHCEHTDHETDPCGQHNERCDHGCNDEADDDV